MSDSEKQCSMMIDRDTRCPEPAAGSTIVRSDESPQIPSPFCRHHLDVIEHENERYERRVTEYVTKRFPIDDPDLRETQAWALKLRHQIYAEPEITPESWVCVAKSPRVVCRNGETMRVTLGNLLPAETRVEADVFTALAEFLTAEADASKNFAALLRSLPVRPEGSTVGEILAANGLTMQGAWALAQARGTTQ